MVRLLVATWRPAFGLRATSSVLKEGGMFARFALLFIESFQTALTLSLLLAVLFSANGQPRQATDDGRCQLEPGGESTVLVISGQNTLHLADGRMVHLAEIITPTNAQGLAQSSSATAYLRSNVLGRKVEIKFGGNRHDRYGGLPSLISSWLANAPYGCRKVLSARGLPKCFPNPIITRAHSN